MAEQIIVVFIIFLAIFTQSLSGFGSALVAMALLPAVIGLCIATPLVALVMITIEVFLLFRYRQALDIDAACLAAKTSDLDFLFDGNWIGALLLGSF